MKNVIRVSILVLLSASLLIKCSKDSPNEPNNTTAKADVILPLTVGNLWDFSSGAGLTVFKKSTCDGNDVFNIKVYTSQGSINDIGYFANLSDGLYVEENDSLYLFLKYPGSAGDRFNVYGNNYWEIISTTKTVNVTAGEFEDCYEYSYFEEGNPVLTYICKPNVGFLYLDDNSQLVSYSLK